MHDARRDQILEIARREGRVESDAIARSFGVTVQTARRDLNALCREGRLARVYGGAVLPSGTRNLRHGDRTDLNASAKERIAALAASMVPNGASVFMDIGTTLEAVARQLAGHEDLLVITNNLHVANVLSPACGVDVILAGGLLRAADGGLVGETTAEFVRQFRPDIALLAASSLSPDGDALDFDFREVRVAQTVMRLAGQSWLLADCSKFARAAPVRIAPLGEFDAFLTDAPPPEPVTKSCAAGGCRVLVAP